MVSVYREMVIANDRGKVKVRYIEKGSGGKGETKPELLASKRSFMYCRALMGLKMQ